MYSTVDAYLNGQASSRGKAPKVQPAQGYIMFSQTNSCAHSSFISIGKQHGEGEEENTQFLTRGALIIVGAPLSTL